MTVCLPAFSLFEFQGQSHHEEELAHGILHNVCMYNFRISLRLQLRLQRCLLPHPYQPPSHLALAGGWTTSLKAWDAQVYLSFSLSFPGLKSQQCRSTAMSSDSTWHDQGQSGKQRVCFPQHCCSLYFSALDTPLTD